MLSPSENRKWARVSFRAGLTFLVGACGGAVFFALHLPLPWLLGALLLTMITSLLGAPVEIKPKFRKALMVILGVMLGGTFTPEVLERVGEWTPTLIAAAGYLGIVAVVAQIYCRRVMGMDRITAMFSAMPGGLSEMILIGEEHGTDVRALTLTHAVRVASVLLAIPFFLTYWSGLDASTAPPSGPIWTLSEVAILGVVGMAGILLGRAVHLPAYHLTGPLLLSVIVHLSGTVMGHRPMEVSIVLQIALGSALGARFFGVSLRSVGRLMVLAVGLAFTMMLVTFLTAGALASFTDFSFEALVLALSPGGVAEMALAALAMNIDPAFVTTHHGLRLLLVVFVSPVLLTYWIRHTS